MDTAAGNPGAILYAAGELGWGQRDLMTIQVKLKDVKCPSP